MRFSKYRRSFSFHPFYVLLSVSSPATAAASSFDGALLIFSLVTRTNLSNTLYHERLLPNEIVKTVAWKIYANNNKKQIDFWCFSRWGCVCAFLPLFHSYHWWNWSGKKGHLHRISLLRMVLLLSVVVGFIFVSLGHKLKSLKLTMFYINAIFTLRCGTIL